MIKGRECESREQHTMRENTEFQINVTSSERAEEENQICLMRVMPY